MQLLKLPRQRGFTLIEIMVGCAISVVGLLVIFQTIAVWNHHSQTTTAGGDADVAGTLAIFNIERDLRLGGVGISTASSTLMGCSVSGSDSSSGRLFSFPMTPVQVNVAASGAPDSIDVLHGNSAFFTDAQPVIRSSTVPPTVSLSRRNGFKQGDLAILAGTSASGVPGCSLIEITNTNLPDGFTVAAENAVPYVSYYAASGASSVPAKYNPATPYPAVTSAMLFSLGPTPARNHWEIDVLSHRVLQRSDVISGTGPFDVAEGVINLKAEYGVDANGDGKIDTTEWTATAPVDWNTVLAIRIAILVRSSQFERSPDAGASSVTGPVTTANPSWADNSAAHQFLMTNVDGTTDNLTAADPVPNNWRYYRYRVFEKVVPLRNMIWG